MSEIIEVIDGVRIRLDLDRAQIIKAKLLPDDPNNRDLRIDVQLFVKGNLFPLLGTILIPFSEKPARSALEHLQQVVKEAHERAGK